MPRILIRPIRGRAARLDFKTILAEVGAEMDATVKPVLVEEHQKIVADWAHEVIFKARKILTRAFIAVDVWAAGDPENVKIWHYVNDGTEPHPIDAKNAPRLKFRLGYVPKTGVGGGYGGAGFATGEWRSPVHVDHPGTDAREFERHIADKMRTWFRRRIEAAFKRGVRRAWKG